MTLRRPADDGLGKSRSVLVPRLRPPPTRAGLSNEGCVPKVAGHPALLLDFRMVQDWGERRRCGAPARNSASLAANHRLGGVGGPPSHVVRWAVPVRADPRDERQRGGEQFSHNLLLTIPMFAAGIAAVSAGALGGAAIARGERSRVVYAVAAVGLIVAVFVMGELLAPH